MIDLLTAHGVRARVTADCVITPFESRVVSLEGYSLESGLLWAMKQVEVPHLIILPYSFAGVLLDHEHTKFMADPDSRLLKLTRGFETTWGYIGVYKGVVDVIACAMTNFAWISSEADPDLITGGNTVFLKLHGR
jgi:hypothetical protein